MRLSATIGRMCAVCVVTLAASFARASDQHVIFAFDQTRDYLLRMHDANGDGDVHDAGEVTIFMDDASMPLGLDNSQGLLAVDPFTVFATDNFVPDNVLLLQDANEDGDAFDANEATIWWDGVLPGGGGMLVNPTCFSRGIDGAFYLIDNNIIDSTGNNEAVYRMSDDNNDGDVNDAGEVTEYFLLSPAGQSLTATFDIEFASDGAGYIYDIRDPNQIEHIDRISPDATTKTVWLTSSNLFSLSGMIFIGAQDMIYDAAADEIITSAGIGAGEALIALRDRNGSNTIDAANEIRTLWRESESGISTGTPRGICKTSDGVIYFTEALNDQIVRLEDLNNDNDYRDAGETTVLYDSAIALANGLPDAPLLLSISCAEFAAFAIGDMNCDGFVSVGDIGPFVLALTDPAGYAAQFPDCDINNGDINDDGIVSVGDIGAFVGLLTAS